MSKVSGFAPWPRRTSDAPPQVDVGLLKGDPVSWSPSAKQSDLRESASGALTKLLRQPSHDRNSGLRKSLIADNDFSPASGKSQASRNRLAVPSLRPVGLALSTPQTTPRGSPALSRGSTPGRDRPVRRASKSPCSAYTSENIKVCVRVRPFNDQERSLGEHQLPVLVHIPSRCQVAIGTDHKQTFSYDRAYQSMYPDAQDYASQQLLMDELGCELQSSVFDGYNSCLFAYGQTGSGKTFSVLGDDKRPENRGILPRILEGIFSEVKSRSSSSTSFVCGATYIEIYNERIRDILRPPGAAEQKLEVRHSPHLGPYIQGLCETPVFEMEDVQKLLQFGMKARTVAATCMNNQSSRSHCIFTLQLQSSSATQDGERQLRARLNLVDLAGSERQRKAQATGQRLKEGSMINRSLTTLLMVVRKLADIGERRRGDSSPNSAFVPFRDSKLTHILQDSLSGNSRTVMIATISPAEFNLDETLGTCRFADSVKSIKTVAVRNQESKGDLVAALRAECELLRAAALNSGDATSRASAEAGARHLEALIGAYGQDLESRLEFAKAQQQMHEEALREMGLTLSNMSSALGLEESTPKFVNISHDSAQSGCLVYFLSKGSDITVGAAAGSSIRINGLGITDTMATIHNSDDLNVKIWSVDGRVLVNGSSISQEQELMLRNDDRIIFGYCFCFRVCMPLAEEDVKAAHENWCSLEKALAEAEEQSEAMQSCHEFIADLHGRLGFQRAQDFFASYRRAHALVEEANAIAAAVRPKDNLRFKVEVSLDLEMYQTDEPECVIRLKRMAHGESQWKSSAARNSIVAKRGRDAPTAISSDVPRSHSEYTRHTLWRTSCAEDENSDSNPSAPGLPGGCDVTLGVFSMASFYARMAHFRDLYEVFQREGAAAVDSCQPEDDPWLDLLPSEVGSLLAAAAKSGSSRVDHVQTLSRQPSKERLHPASPLHREAANSQIALLERQIEALQCIIKEQRSFMQKVRTVQVNAT